MEGTHSPYHALLGIAVVEWREGFVRLECRTVEGHANRSGITFNTLCTQAVTAQSLQHDTCAATHIQNMLRLLKVRDMLLLHAQQKIVVSHAQGIDPVIPFIFLTWLALFT